MQVHSMPLRRGLMLALWAGLALPVAAQDTPLTGDEIKAAWADKEVSGRTVTGRQFWMTMKSDGNAGISIGEFSDTGQWRPMSSGYCAKWIRIRNGKEACFTVRKSGDVFVIFNDDGSENGRVHNVR